jgi:hypothetical protein
VTGHSAEALIASRRRDSTRRRLRVLNALERLSATGEEVSVSAVARAAGVDRSFLYRHHDLRAQIHAQAVDPTSSPASAKASRQSLLADLANLRDQAQRLRRQNASLIARLSELLGQEVFRASGLAHTDGTEALQARIRELEQQLLGLRQQLEERTDELDAARAANRDLMTLANRAPAAQASS